MSKDQTLQRVEDDVACGNLGKARDRLHGLLRAYPNDLQLRVRLAGIYSKLQYPAMAGRYWYLEESKTDIMERACREFEMSCGNDPWRILLCIKFQGDIGAITTSAKAILLELQAQCRKKYNYTIQFGKKGREKYKAELKEKVSSSLAVALWLLLLILFLVFTIIGLVVAISWIF